MEKILTEEHIIYLNDEYSIGMQYEEGAAEARILFSGINGDNQIITVVDSEAFGALARAFGRAYQDTQV